MLSRLLRLRARLRRAIPHVRAAHRTQVHPVSPTLDLVVLLVQAAHLAPAHPAPAHRHRAEVIRAAAIRVRTEEVEAADNFSKEGAAHPGCAFILLRYYLVLGSM
jgi:hypothetical protein